MTDLGELRDEAAAEEINELFDDVDETAMDIEEMALGALAEVDDE